MSKTISLLATTVIENIEHSCKFEEEGCIVKSLVGEVEKHRQACPFRPAGHLPRPFQLPRVIIYIESL